jgi:hypothetical protein
VGDDVVEITDVTPVAPPQTQVIMGAAALALMSEAEFERNLAALEVARARADRIKRALMVEGADFGRVPGVEKPFLFKAGAETLDKAFGLVATFEVTRLVGTAEDQPPYSYRAHCLVHLGSSDGPVVGEGVGVCNPWESRYRYRKGGRVCPSCGAAALIRGKAEFGGGWICWAKRGGCGAKFAAGDPAIEGQDAGATENPDPWDLENTVAKMAVKRAHVDGTIRATGTSSLFTQDEDSPAVRAAHSEEPTPRAGSRVLGTVALNPDKPTQDGQLRVGPDGQAQRGFRLVSDGRGVLVEARGDVADAYEPRDGDAIEVEGTMEDRQFQGRDGPVRYRVLVAAHIARADGAGVTPPAPASAARREAAR